MFWPHACEDLQVFLLTLHPPKVSTLSYLSCSHAGNSLEHPLPTLGSSTTTPSQPRPRSLSHSSPNSRKPESYPYPTGSRLEGALESLQGDSEIHRGEGTCLRSHREIAAGPGLAPGLPACVQPSPHRSPTAALSLLSAPPAFLQHLPSGAGCLAQGLTVPPALPPAFHTQESCPSSSPSSSCFSLQSFPD